MLLIASPAHAQNVARDSSDAQTRVDLSGPATLGGILGSAAGLSLGFVAGAGLGWGGGDDPGLLGALLFAGVGSVTGTSMGIHLGSSRRVPVKDALAPSTIGILAGAATAVLLQRVTDGRLNGGGVLLGFSVGQGITSAALTLNTSATCRSSAC